MSAEAEEVPLPFVKYVVRTAKIVLSGVLQRVSCQVSVSGCLFYTYILCPGLQVYRTTRRIVKSCPPYVLELLPRAYH